jgi:ADP-heptose:LPS heptosyltransferase
MPAFSWSVIGVRRCYPDKGGKSTKSQRRILILFPGSLGDFLCFLPALQFMQAANPGCQLEIAARGDGLALAHRLPEVARTLSLESGTFAKLFSRQSSFTAEEEQLFISVDEILSWFGHARPEVNAALQRIGARHVRFFPFFSGQKNLHAAAYYLRCVGGTELLCPSLVIGDEEKQELETYWRQCGWDARSRILVLHPGSGGKKKRWASAGFSQVAHWWISRGNTKVVILLGPAEEQEAEAWRLIGQVESSLSVWQAAALLSRADLYVGNDSGVSHLAGSVGARGVVLFGPTQPQQWRPLGGALSVLQNLQYRTEHPADEAGIALTEIAAEEIIAALLRLGA